MKEWCLTHWFCTFLIICLLILCIDGAITNICSAIKRGGKGKEDANKRAD
jgi:hypothetical protein